MKEATCKQCNSKFLTKRKHAKTCSSKCRSRVYSAKHRNKEITKVCQYIDCSDQFKVSGFNTSKVYCSKICRNKQRAIREIASNERLKRRLRTDCVESLFKENNTQLSIGCTTHEFKVHLEAQFYPNPETGDDMTWDNRGFYGWHIDHIKPLASFDLTDPEQFKEACHYTNLQPMWATENLKKGTKQYNKHKEEQGELNEQE